MSFKQINDYLDALGETDTALGINRAGGILPQETDEFEDHLEAIGLDEVEGIMA